MYTCYCVVTPPPPAALTYLRLRGLAFADAPPSLVNEPWFVAGASQAIVEKVSNKQPLGHVQPAYALHMRSHVL